MHVLGLTVLVALGIWIIVALGARWYRSAVEARSLVALVLGVVVAWLANIDLWRLWSLPDLRYGWVGVTLTGLALGGLALLWDGVIGLVSGLYRKVEDEAETLERRDLKRVA
ncbi:hypothetical protein Afer_0819 [Acidimicrobium ferrooxidans DSM 10331]|uniref:Uncharacterized protein n=1 Tax=Acidimicrobium ferrooxidans (strain DSM 10331 / JCM 15462 / NBRC 103882 / ICP) TaxID=525909 RepID=C7LYF7_ACIFD|nr:hypothetical protein [Acidimicrobium ferrooxidans]ACU53765.1 hypothetical protein Afer_0819 [Acidimicrobium ferrooxidans DSM 10331]